KQAKAAGPEGPVGLGFPVGIISGPPDQEQALDGRLCLTHTSPSLLLSRSWCRGGSGPTYPDFRAWVLSNGARPPGGRTGAGAGSSPAGDTPTSPPCAAPGTASARRRSRTP